jgi:hypothetical protein
MCMPFSDWCGGYEVDRWTQRPSLASGGLYGRWLNNGDRSTDGDWWKNGDWSTEG